MNDHLRTTACVKSVKLQELKQLEIREDFYKL